MLFQLQERKRINNWIEIKIDVASILSLLILVARRTNPAFQMKHSQKTEKWLYFLLDLYIPIFVSKFVNLNIKETLLANIYNRNKNRTRCFCKIFTIFYFQFLKIKDIIVPKQSFEIRINVSLGKSAFVPELIIFPGEFTAYLLLSLFKQECGPYQIHSEVVLGNSS